LVAELGGLIKG